MTPERRLAENIRRLNPVAMWMTQGEVIAVDGQTCTVQIGDAQIQGVRLRASLSSRERQMLVVPKVGSPVTLGCLTGDLNNLVVLQVDEIESVTINGGKLGGLVNIEALTDKINELVDAFNRHNHTLTPGAVITTAGPNTNPVTVPAPARKASRLNKQDYEDPSITH